MIDPVWCLQKPFEDALMPSSRMEIAELSLLRSSESERLREQMEEAYV